MGDAPRIAFDLFGDGSQLLVTLLVFLAAAGLALAVMLTMRARGAVKRRAAGIAEGPGEAANRHALRATSIKAVQRLLDYTTKHYAANEKEQDNVKVLRR